MMNQKFKKATIVMGLVAVMTGAICGCGKQDESGATTETASAVNDVVTTAEASTEDAQPQDTTEAAQDDDTVYSAENIIGSYACDRATIMISGAGGEDVNIDISWSSSAFTSGEWTITGTFDPETNSVTYTNAEYKEVEYADDGTSTENIVYTDGSGSFEFDMIANTLVWNDDKENIAEDMVFSRFNINGTVEAQ